MLWIGEVEDSKCIDDLITFSIYNRKTNTGFRADSGHSEQGTSRNSAEGKAKPEKRSLTGRLIAWMIYDFFNISGGTEAVLDFRDRNDNVQAFDIKWDEVLPAVTDRPSDHTLESR